MTIELDTIPAVAGEKATRIRDILRRSHGAFREDWLSDKFGYDECRAGEIARALETAGYVRHDGERVRRNNSPFPWYSVTNLGEEVARASAARRISRETADAALMEFMKRVQTVNASPVYLYSVKFVAVFGSFLERRSNLGDVDVAVDLKSRVAFDERHNWVEIFQQHAWESGKSFSAWDEEIDWPRQEVLLVLKSRKRSISIQSWYSFMEMGKSRSFRYKVLLGDAKEIRCELARVRRKHNRHHHSDS
jgi:predicted nucleotidyltransferase